MQGKQGSGASAGAGRSNGEDAGEWQIVNHKKSSRINQAKVSNKLVSLFVDNLPRNINAKRLRQMFERFRVVLNAFVPKSFRVERSLHYGFVHYATMFEAKFAIDGANGAWLEDERLQVKLANQAHGLRPVHDLPLNWSKKTETSAKNLHPLRSHNTQGKEQIETTVDLRNYNYVGKQSSVVGIHIDSNNDSQIGGWELCGVGKLREVSILPHIQGRLLSKGFSAFKLAYASGNNLLLIFEEMTEKKKILENPGKLKEWFSEIHNWIPSFIVSNRLCWIKCVGIPWKLWNTECFNRIGNIFGSTVLIEDHTVKKDRLDRARILICTELVEPISKHITLQNKGISFKVFVREEAHLDATTHMGRYFVDEKSPVNPLGSSDVSFVPNSTEPETSNHLPSLSLTSECVADSVPNTTGLVPVVENLETHHPVAQFKVSVIKPSNLETHPVSPLHDETACFTSL
uniref:RRM domain-containing protein n=1 Tax=Kalanchoe fedtschenkoi TaxID=63787 RepID=A0A7N0U325_KALFE